jgi:uncharacterized membrane protein YkvA (DUF1232 family)
MPFIKQFRLTIRMLNDPRVSYATKAIPLVVLLYVLSPVDLIPDMIPLVGLIDDVAILLAGMRLFEAFVPDYIVYEHRAALEMDVPR